MVHLVSYQTRLPSTLFFELLQPYPLAQRLLVIYCRKADAKTLKDYLYHSDQPHEAAVLAAVEGYVDAKESKLPPPPAHSTICPK